LSGGLGLVAIIVCMILGGISGSGAADAAAVAAVMLPSMLKEGYPRAFCASLIGAAGSTAVLIPPSLPFILYAVLVPGVSVPALFIGGIVPGLLAGLSLMLPALLLARVYGFGTPDANAEVKPLWTSFYEAIWRNVASLAGEVDGGVWWALVGMCGLVVAGLFHARATSFPLTKQDNERP
jgi:TRAP-type C4-dicarboxylate transport system permease large subunit